MKTLILICVILFVFAFFKESNSQSQFYLEQVSGVTTSLNSSSFIGGFTPVQAWICGANSVVLKTSNAGVNWISANGNISQGVNLVTISCAGLDTALTAGNIGANTFVYRTTNGGAAWIQVFSQANGNINAIFMKDSHTGFMTGNPVVGRWSLWKTMNGGMTWDSTGMYIPQAGSEIGWQNSLMIMNNTVVFGTNNSRIYRSTNFGLNWAAVSTTPEINSSAVWIYADTAGYTYMQSGGSTLNYTTNGGINWLPLTCPDTGNFIGLDAAYAGASNGVLNQPYETYAVRNNSNIYIGGGTNYFKEYTCPAGVYNNMSYGFVLLGGETNFSWAVRNNGGITRVSLFRGGVVRTISTEIPKSFSLEQNYPNPFNPSTKIRFGLEREAFASIKVYDVLGREVAVIANEQLHAGQYEADFDASSLSSGIYYYRISAGDYSEVKKMVLVK